MIDRKKIARHARSFGRYQKIEHPSHREKLLQRTPHGKYERMYLLMANMGKEIASFLAMAESEGEDRLQVGPRPLSAKSAPSRTPIPVLIEHSFR